MTKQESLAIIEEKMKKIIPTKKKQKEIKNIEGQVDINKKVKFTLNKIAILVLL